MSISFYFLFFFISPFLIQNLDYTLILHFHICKFHFSNIYVSVCVCTHVRACVCIVGTCSLILWFKTLSKTRGTINLCYGLILICNGIFGQEHVKIWESLYFVVWCVTWISFECFSYSLSLSLSLSCVVPHFFLPFLLYEPSPPFSYIVFIHLHNFWLYRALFSWFFIINGDFWGLLYCSDVHLYNFWSYRAHLFFWFFIMNGDF